MRRKTPSGSFVPIVCTLRVQWLQRGQHLLLPISSSNVLTSPKVAGMAVVATAVVVTATRAAHVPPDPDTASKVAAMVNKAATSNDNPAATALRGPKAVALPALKVMALLGPKAVALPDPDTVLLGLKVVALPDPAAMVLPDLADVPAAVASALPEAVVLAAADPVPVAPECPKNCWLQKSS